MRNVIRNLSENNKQNTVIRQHSVETPLKYYEEVPPPPSDATRITQNVETSPKPNETEETTTEKTNEEPRTSSRSKAKTVKFNINSNRDKFYEYKKKQGEECNIARTN